MREEQLTPTKMGLECFHQRALNVDNGVEVKDRTSMYKARGSIDQNGNSHIKIRERLMLTIV
jgi:hypothetical protein